MRALVFVNIIEEVARAHAQVAPLEWFLSTPGLRVLLIRFPVTDTRGSTKPEALDENHIES